MRNDMELLSEIMAKDRRKIEPEYEWRCGGPVGTMKASASQWVEHGGRLVGVRYEPVKRSMFDRACIWVLEKLS